jgi:leukotriene A-4 hydrolase/aminopeptidase
MKIRLVLLFVVGLMAMNCQNQQKTAPAASETKKAAAHDAHSYSNPGEVKVKHVDLDSQVIFERKVLRGTATLRLERLVAGAPLKLDTRELKIEKTEISTDGTNFQDIQFALGTPDKFLGTPLEIKVPDAAGWVRVTYETSPNASGLQWLDPPQTAGKKYPYLFTQSEAIHARSWIPLQDSPQVRITYTARVRTPTTVRAVMSAENDPQAPHNGDYHFKMTQPIPSYLIALAVGDIDFRSLGARAGVYAEPSVVEKAASEFADTEKMIEATEKLYGPYRWDRYDILVLPPSFPIGGMENPRLTFATPTVIAGDRSLVSLIAHELAHSWSGNLVTNATWRDFWLNEGFTTYLERRVTEAVYGRAREEMEATLGRQDLEKEMAPLEPRDQILHVNLDGRDPDDGFTNVPYEKGALFLRLLEETFGRDTFDRFLRGYFDHFAFQSVTTEDFLAYLKKNLLDADPARAAKINLDEWIEKPGLPANAPRPASDAFTKVAAQADSWLKGEQKLAALPTASWTTQEWLHFLRHLPTPLTAAQMAELDASFNLTKSGNSEIAHQWLLMSIRNHYAVADPRLEEYLIQIGRRKLIKPLYEELLKTPEGRKRAEAIYAKARPGYHPITQVAIDAVMKPKA